jgi:hypothetical protein
MPKHTTSTQTDIYGRPLSPDPMGGPNPIRKPSAPADGHVPMSLPFHLHFLVHGPLSFTWEGDDPEMPGIAIADVFKDAGTFISVDLSDGTSETRTIPCRIARGETARVYSRSSRTS